jgi:hypothetical protein
MMTGKGVVYGSEQLGQFFVRVVACARLLRLGMCSDELARLGQEMLRT